jgi:hypothetical protein
LTQYAAIVNGKQVYSDKPITVSNNNWSIGSDTPSGVYVPASANNGQAAYIPGATAGIGQQGQTVIVMPGDVHSSPVEPVTTYVPPSQYAAYPWAAPTGYVPPAQQAPVVNYNPGSAVVPTTQQSAPVQGPTPTTTTSSNDILPSTGGVSGMIDKVAPVFVLLILVKIVSGIGSLIPRGH